MDSNLRKHSLFFFLILVLLLVVRVPSFTKMPVTQTAIKEAHTLLAPLAETSVPLPAPQDPLWIKTYGGSYREEDGWVIEVSDGGYAIAGTIDNFLPKSQDIWLIRTDTNGNELWNRTYGGTGREVARNLIEVSTGGFAIVGTTTSYGAGGPDIWFVRVDASGNHLWNTTFVGYWDDDIVYESVEVSTGGFAIAGGTQKFTLGNYEAWLIRVDTAGNELWNQTYGGAQDDWANALVEASDGGFTLLCTTGSYGAGTYDSWLIHTDDSGNPQWNQTYGYSGDERSGFLKKVSSGGYAFTAISRSFDSDGNSWFVRTDASGNHLWNRSYGGSERDFASALDELSNGEFILAGLTESFGGIPEDLWLVRTDASGNLYWHYTLGGWRGDYALKVLEITGGGFIVSGTAKSYGSPHGDVWLVRFPDPAMWWGTEPSDQTHEFGFPFSYEINASTKNRIDGYWLNDTTNFAIDGSGLITNVVTLTVNTYGLQLWVNDTLDNRINVNFSVTVEDTINPQITTTQRIWNFSEEEPVTGVVIEATDFAGIDNWTINYRTSFNITTVSATSISITNITNLTPSNYPIDVTAFDPSGNSDSISITIKIVFAPEPQIPEFPIAAVGLGLGLGLVLSGGIIFFIRRRKQ
jgi:hypothetical protein